jgi:hypothetical protein
MYYKTSQL